MIDFSLHKSPSIDRTTCLFSLSDYHPSKHLEVRLKHSSALSSYSASPCSLHGPLPNRASSRNLDTDEHLHYGRRTIGLCVAPKAGRWVIDPERGLIKRTRFLPDHRHLQLMSDNCVPLHRYIAVFLDVASVSFAQQVKNNTGDFSMP